MMMNRWLTIEAESSTSQKLLQLNCFLEIHWFILIKILAKRLLATLSFLLLRHKLQKVLEIRTQGSLRTSMYLVIKNVQLLFWFQNLFHLIVEEKSITH